MSGPYSSGLDNIPSQAVVTLAPGASLTDFMAAHDLELVSTLDLPAAGSFGAQTYYLVHDTGDKEIDFNSFSFDARLNSYSPHNRVWMPEDDRGGLSFDDDHGWRTSTQYSSQPAINQVHILQARLQTEGWGEVIAILDSGIDPTHPLFTTNHVKFSFDKNYLVFPPVSGVLESARNGADEDLDGTADDGVGHGTHVTGIAFTGARKATFRIYKVLDAEGRGTVFGLAKAAKAAADANVTVINLSLGLNADDVMLHHVLQHCADRNIAVVASAGNKDSNIPQYPGAYDAVFSVTAVDAQNIKASFANYGSTVDLSAPGVDIVSPIPSSYGSGKYAVASGTSMATPFVTAAVALVHAKYGDIGNPVESAVHVMTLTDDINPFNPAYAGQLGSGRVNFDAAVSMPILPPPQE